MLYLTMLILTKNWQEKSPPKRARRQCEQVVRINFYLNSSCLFCNVSITQKKLLVNKSEEKNEKILFRYGYRN